MRMVKMIKGVNRQILEVTSPDSPYFERIIFFVRNDFEKADEGKLKQEAEKLYKSAKKPPKTRKTLKQKLLLISYIALGLGAGCALSALMSALV